MRCIAEGHLRAYLDDELAGAERDRIAAHLDGCGACARRLAALREEVAAVAAILAGTAWAPEPRATGIVLPEGERRRAAAALATFQARLRAADAETSERGMSAGHAGMTNAKEWVTQMFARMTSPRRRPAFALVATLALLALALAFSPVQSLAEELMRTFRVQQFSAVTVRVPGMDHLPRARQISDAEKTQAIQVLSALGALDTSATPASAREIVSQAEAKAHFAKQGGKTLRVPRTLPAAFAGQAPRYGISDPVTARYTLNVPVAQQYLMLANVPELNALPWPAGVSQLTFGLDMPAGVALAYGDQTRGFGVVQMASPTLTVPDELDVNAFRAAILALPGLPQDTVAQIKAVEDWEKTLIIPVPQDATTSNVTVKGNGGLFDRGDAGLLIVDGQGRGSLLLWESAGVLYAVGGQLTGDEALAVANSLATAP